MHCATPTTQALFSMCPLSVHLGRREGALHLTLALCKSLSCNNATTPLVSSASWESVALTAIHWMRRHFGIMDEGLNTSTFLGVGCLKLWQLIKRKMASEIWGFVKCIPVIGQRIQLFMGDALKLSFRRDATAEDLSKLH